MVFLLGWKNPEPWRIVAAARPGWKVGAKRGGEAEVYRIMNSQPASPITLRIFSGGVSREMPASGTPINSSCTLTQLFDQAFEPLWCQSRSLSQGTRTLFREALGYWARLTGDPPIAKIDDWTTAKFSAAMRDQPGRKASKLSVATVRKHCARIDKLLAFAGPRTREPGGRKNLGLIELPPVVDMPAPDLDPPAGDFSLAEVQAMHDAAISMHSPRVAGVSPAAWWRALLAVACSTGLRIGQLMRLQYVDLHPPHIMVWARNSKGRKGKKQYLSPEALAEINAIRTDRQLIFEFPNWERNPRWLQHLFKRLAAKAHIAAARRFGFHGLRKLHATLIADGASGQDGVRAAQISLGHSSPDVTKQHYVSGSVQEKLAAAAIDRLPSIKRKVDEDPRQKKLFE